MLKIFQVWVFVFAFFMAATAQTLLKISKTETPPRIDGVLDLGE